jgi:hypothetical protein
MGTDRSRFKTSKGFVCLDLLTWLKLSRKLMGMRELPGIVAIFRLIARKPDD